MSTNQEINEHLDIIANSLYENSKASPDIYNVIHTCRPGHPWNKESKKPFNYLELSLKLNGYYRHVPSVQRCWLSQMVIIEDEHKVL